MLYCNATSHCYIACDISECNIAYNIAYDIAYDIACDKKIIASVMNTDGLYSSPMMILSRLSVTVGRRRTGRRGSRYTASPGRASGTGQSPSRARPTQSQRG